MSKEHLNIPLLSELFEKGQTPDYLFWVGCANSFDARISKIAVSLYKIFKSAELSFAVLGKEESCTGDPAKRAGNEYLFQMQAFKNIQTLGKYRIENIITSCPHCFNSFKNEYPELGGHYNVFHYTELISKLIEEGKIDLEKRLEGQNITYHDPCYLARANDVTESPRQILKKLGANLVEMPNNKRSTFCCGAGGAQIFKESEKGNKEINNTRFEQAKKTGAKIIATGCPFCKIMLSDAAKDSEDVQIKDISELISNL